MINFEVAIYTSKKIFSSEIWFVMTNNTRDNYIISQFYDAL